MKVFPQAMATGNIHIGTIAGKLNGEIPTHTPSGCRKEWLSTPVPTLSEKLPFSRWGIPQANSTTSIPRVREPRASLRTLPCSAVISPDNSPAYRSSSSLNRNRTLARRSGGVAAQAGNAAAAAATASSTSLLPAKETRPVISPVAGS